jgi:hypothetical protein
VSDRAWKSAYKGNHAALMEYRARHRPTRALWWARLLGLLWPSLPARVLAERQRRYRIKEKFTFKKRVHEATADPVGFQEKYAPPVITGGAPRT